MRLSDAALATFEYGINQVLRLDPAVCARLAALHGRVIRVELSGLQLALNFVPSAEGNLRLLGRIEGVPDCTLYGSPIDLARAGSQHDGTAQLFAGHVRIEGDTAIAQAFSEALAGLDIDWEERLSKLVGDAAAFQLGQGLRRVRGEADRVRSNAGDALSEFVTEEARLSPHRHEIAEFLAEVDILRDDTERLAARIALLEQKRNTEST